MLFPKTFGFYWNVLKYKIGNWLTLPTANLYSRCNVCNKEGLNEIKVTHTLVNKLALAEPLNNFKRIFKAIHFWELLTAISP